MAYPSTISNFTYPNHTQRLNNPSQSSIIGNLNDAILEIQRVVGTDASTLGTIIGDLRNTDSNGGGHIQAANKGGTGQTAFIKGDILIASSSSVLAKLAVSSTTGEVLTARPTAAVGLEWAAASSGTKVAIIASTISVARGATSIFQTVFAASIAGSLLGTNNGIKYTGQILRMDGGAGPSVLFAVNYGNNIVSSFVVGIPNTQFSSVVGKIEGIIVANNSSVAQVGYANALVGRNIPTTNVPSIIYAFGNGNSSVDSSAPQNLIIQAQYSAVDTLNSILTGIFIVEKIV